RRLLQRIHRYTVDAHRESIKPVSLQAYMHFLFELHGIQPLAPEGDGVPARRPPLDHGALQRVLERLDGFTAPAAAWESDLLPARLPGYDPAWLDFLCVSGKAAWGRRRPPRPARAADTEAVADTADGEPAREAARRAGPVKTSPLNIVLREHLGLWRTLAASESAEQEPRPGADARRVLEIL